MGNRLSVVTPSVDQETVDTLWKLLQEAHQGQITGLCYVVIHRGQDYSGDVVGRARGFPAFALGMIRALEHRITQLL
jgi:hypothetical protein